MSSEHQPAGADETKEVLFYYLSTEIDVVTTDLLINFSNFVSAIGGNLGMFIGFSLLGAFSGFYDMSKQLCSRNCKK